MLSFTVVTCCWNSEPYIEQCIASVRAQSHPAVEQVFVDGGSVDGTLQRIRALGGRSRAVFDVRGGISHAMNVGARLSSADVIAHLHADDYYLDDEVIARVAVAMQRTGAQWLFGRVVSDIDGQQVTPLWAMPRYSAKALVHRNFIAHPATFVRRELFLSAGGFDEDLRYAMDYDLWLRLSRQAQPCFLDSYLAAFRRHAGGASTANAGAAFEEDQQVRMRHVGPYPARRAYHRLVHAWRRLRRQGAGVLA